jgi:DNA-directed RNA polymerase subunit RPC12/RpoP
MNVAFACPRCSQSVRLEVPEGAASIACPACRGELVLPPDAYRDGEVHRCLVCPSTELFVRKDFPQQLGVGIVVVGIVLSCIAWSMYRPYWTFGVLFATAAIDVVLWFVVPNCLNCYRCDAQYRGLRGLDKHAGFDLETHERYRQQGIRLREAARAADRRGTSSDSPPASANGPSPVPTSGLPAASDPSTMNHTSSHP